MKFSYCSVVYTVRRSHVIYFFLAPSNTTFDYNSKETGKSEISRELRQSVICFRFPRISRSSAEFRDNSIVLSGLLWICKTKCQDCWLRLA